LIGSWEEKINPDKSKPDDSDIQGENAAQGHKDSEAYSPRTDEESGTIKEVSTNGGVI
jgi:hypothetical protein